MPVRGGSIDELRALLNVRVDADFVMIVAWLVAALRDAGPYPVLVLSGEQGSAKSTFAKILRALVDPNAAPVRALPRDERDLSIAANNAHVLAFDNISSLPAWMSDAFCRLATGGGFATRQLFSDASETLFDGVRPIVVNGIEDFVSRPDLADRALFVTLEPIPEERRRPEAEIWSAFEAARPRIFGVLLDAVAEGLRRLPETHLAKLPRMADFALWFSACETAFWPAGTFMSAYAGNRDDAVGTVVQADAVAAAIVSLMEAMQTAWNGTASELLRALALVTDERVVASKSWPESPQALSGRLRRAATFLRKVGIVVNFEREGREGTRVVRITRTDDVDDADDGSDNIVSVRALNHKEKTDADDADAELHTEEGMKLSRGRVIPKEADRGGKTASASSASSAAEAKSCPVNDLAGHSMPTHRDHADDDTVRSDGVTETSTDGPRAGSPGYGRDPGR